MEKLIFGTAGMPTRTNPREYEQALKDLNDMKLGALEMEFVHGVRMNEKTKELLKKEAPNQNIVLTAHGPYYINLNSQEEEKIEASVTRILDTARVAYACGAYSITFHAAFYMKQNEDFVYNQVKAKMREITETLKSENIKIWVRPETTGKGTQWGSIDEIIKLSKEFDMVLPCVDFSHLHARSVGQYNTYDEFSRVFEKIGTEIGDYALQNFHAHLAGIEYGAKGEKHHLMLEESDMNYKDLLRAFKDFNVKGVVICESPDMETDAMMIQKYYESL